MTEHRLMPIKPDLPLESDDSMCALEVKRPLQDLQLNRGRLRQAIPAEKLKYPSGSTAQLSLIRRVVSQVFCAARDPSVLLCTHTYIHSVYA